MQIRLIAIGTKMPEWVEAGYQAYAKRFPPFCSLQLIEIAAEKNTKNSDPERLKKREGEKILNIIKPDHLIIALDIKGQSWSSEQLAGHLKHWQIDRRNIDLIIGGPEGLASECLKKADIKWSLSSLTLPHPLVRIFLAEQLYRATTILQNHPYHR